MALRAGRCDLSPGRAPAFTGEANGLPGIRGRQCPGASRGRAAGARERPARTAPIRRRQRARVRCGLVGPREAFPRSRASLWFEADGVDQQGRSTHRRRGRPGSAPAVAAGSRYGSGARVAAEPARAHGHRMGRHVRTTGGNRSGCPGSGSFAGCAAARRSPLRQPRPCRSRKCSAGCRS